MCRVGRHINMKVNVIEKKSKGVPQTSTKVLKSIVEGATCVAGDGGEGQVRELLGGEKGCVIVSTQA